MDYELVGDASRIVFSARSSVHPIHVEVPQLRGALAVESHGEDLTITPGAWLEVELADVRSGNPLIDRETRRRLDLQRHPLLTAELTDARPVARGRLACRGQVTFQGRTEPVTGELELREDDAGRVHLGGRREIDVRRWGLKPPRLLVLKVDPEVTVELAVVARPSGPGTGDG